MSAETIAAFAALDLCEVCGGSGLSPVHQLVFELAIYGSQDPELAAYSDELAARPQIVVGRKAELPGTATRRAKLEKHCARRGLPFLVISSVTGLGIRELIADVGARLRAERWAGAAR